MLSTYLSAGAAQKLRHGLPFVERGDILRMEGTQVVGEPATLRDEEGHSLGVGDVDLEAAQAVRRLGLPQESAEGVIPRQVRRALLRRGKFLQNPRYCRVVNDDGDGLPGLVIDRYDTHYVVQTLTRAMDARAEEIARSLSEVGGAQSVLLRNDSPARTEAGLPRQPPHVLLGHPPRWTRVLELEARLTVDIQYGVGTGYFYDQRQLRRVISRMANGARVLDACCYVGGLFVHAGLHGARRVVGYDIDPDAVELARENAEANGLLGRVHLEAVDAFEALDATHDPFDLVLLDSPDFNEEDGEERFLQLLRLCIRHTRHGGYLIAAAYHPALPYGATQLDERVARACEEEERVAFRLARPGLPFDFPTVVGSPMAEYMSALALEVT